MFYLFLINCYVLISEWNFGDEIIINFVISF